MLESEGQNVCVDMADNQSFMWEKMNHLPSSRIKHLYTCNGKGDQTLNRMTIFGNAYCEEFIDS